MSLAGFACAWHYRGKLQEGAYNIISYVLWPLVSALFMVFIAVYSLTTFDVLSSVMGIGGIAMGVVPLLFSGLRRARGATAECLP